MKRFYLMLLLLLLPMTTVHAGDEMTAKPVFTFKNNPETFDSRIDFTEALWSPDSQSFNFNFTVASNALVYHYDIPSNTFETSESYSCAYGLNEEQSKRFNDTLCAQSVSPDGHYILFYTGQSKCGEGCVLELAIGDLETGMRSNLQLWTSGNYSVIWSENSSAFLVSDYGIGSFAGGLGAIWYVSIPQVLTPTHEIPSILLSNFSLGEQGYVDISPDGQQVLIRGGLNSGLGLSLWNTSMPSSNQQFAAWFDGRWLLKDQNIGGATFLPDDPQHILVVMDEGILKFDLKTETSTVINKQIKGAAPNWVYFSPDVQYALDYTVLNDTRTRNQKITLYQLN